MNCAAVDCNDSAGAAISAPTCVTAANACANARSIDRAAVYRDRSATAAVFIIYANTASNTHAAIDCQHGTVVISFNQYLSVFRHFQSGTVITACQPIVCTRKDDMGLTIHCECTGEPFPAYVDFYAIKFYSGVHTRRYG